MKKLTIGFMAAVVLAPPMAEAQAQDGYGGHRLIEVQEIVEACRADYFHLCPGVGPGRGRILECLSTYQRQLSTSCHAALAISIAIRSCRFDYNRFCRDVDPRGGRVVGCLKAHERDLSDICRDAISERRPYGRPPGPHGEMRQDYEGRGRLGEPRRDTDYPPAPDYGRGAGK
jgi:hypothetical protein